jgi:glycosyltransferase involved in cell wall biosynthesis
VSPPGLIFVSQTHTIWGGMEWWIDEFGRWMAGQGWRVTAGLASGWKYNRPAPFCEAHPGLEPIVMHAEVGTETSRVSAVARAIRKSGARVVIPNAIAATYPAVRALKAGGADIRFVVPVLSQHPDTLANIVNEIDIIDAVVPNNHLAETLLRRSLGEQADRVHYVFQGTPPGQRRAGAKSGRLRAGYVGRFEEISKRIFDLPPLLDLLGDDVEVHLYGDGPDRDELLRRVRGRATWHGYLSKTDLYRKAYRELDVLLLFSPTEGSPNAVYEAMQNGVVPVTSRFLGQATEGIIRHGQNALTFQVGDVTAAAAELVSLARDRALLDRLSQEAFTTVAARTDVAMHAAWQSILEQTLDRAPIRPERRNPVARGHFGIPESFLDPLRSLLHRRFPHGGGWEEWPGSQPIAGELVHRVIRELSEIDSERK